MKFLLFYIPLQLYINCCFSQKLSCPISDGMIHYNTPHMYFPSNPAFGVTITSSSENAVKCVLSGQVIRVMKSGESYSVFVQKGDTVMLYANLSESLLRKRQFVTEHSLVGKCLKDDSLGYLLRLTLWVKGNRVDPLKILTCEK